MYCGNCGKEIEDNVSFCPECGALIENNQSKSQKKKVTKRRRKKSVIILFIVFVCILAGSVVLFKVVKDKRYKNNMDIVKTRKVAENPIQNFNTEKEKIEKLQQEKIDKVSESVPKTPTGFSTEYAIEDAKDGYFIVSKFDGVLYGLLDSYGNVVIPVEYDEIMFPESQKAQAVLVKAEGKMGLIDYHGKAILPLEYSKISNSGNTSDFYLVEKDGGQSIVELDGKIHKSLYGKYDYFVSNSFLAIGESPEFTEIYSLDEQVLFTSENVDVDYAKKLNINDYISVFRTSSSSIDLMNAQGNIVLSCAMAKKGTEGYGGIWNLETDNLLSIFYYPEGMNDLQNTHKLINVSEKKISEKYYNGIFESGGSILAEYYNQDGTFYFDIYNLEGQFENTIEFKNVKEMVFGEGLIAVKYEKTYRIYDTTGKEVSDERYLNVKKEKDFLIIQNLNGEYGLMAPDGTMCIDFGNIGEESYNGLPWKQTYVFGDTFCIVTENSKGNNVWFF